MSMVLLPSFVHVTKIKTCLFFSQYSVDERNYCETNTFMSCQVVADVKGDTTGGAIA